jgi:hypothetical protein
MLADLMITYQFHWSHLTILFGGLATVFWGIGFMHSAKKRRAEMEKQAAESKAWEARERTQDIEQQKRRDEELAKQKLDLGEWWPFCEQMNRIKGSHLRLVFLRKIMDQCREFPPLSMAGLSLMLELFGQGNNNEERKAAEELLSQFVTFNFPQ